MKTKIGRPIKLTEDVLENIILGINKGLTLKIACRLSGISYSTLALWIFKGKKAKELEINNKYTNVEEKIISATKNIKIKHRDMSLLALKSRDFRYGWNNPMSLQVRNKIKNFWQKRKNRLSI